MKKVFLSLVVLAVGMSAMAAYQYEKQGRQRWLSFTSETTLAFDLSRGGKTNDHENFIDRGEGVADYGWYNLDTGASGSFSNGAAATFQVTDRIGLYVTDNTGKTYLSTNPTEPFEDDVFGKTDLKNGDLQLYGGNMGSNGSHEFYVFKFNSANAANKTPSGQPLPGIIATLVVGGGALVYLKKRKQLYASK